ncbi:hypothetical protein NC652_034874 [Populus alba x Populus x berolinensis]|uniref:Uncharacterized protein n=1 Tax=Populus tomentosa TaxID=118781 RepID=A0A8X7YKP6_POPTO|nr:hypothetical protein POTOM_049326 [Populus tomentosa]KAJ6875277.1 hypothetical protein NC652_034874 [Populus alba x Populus x berolinensis]
MIYTHNLRASLRLSVRKLVPAMAGVHFRLLVSFLLISNLVYWSNSISTRTTGSQVHGHDQLRPILEDTQMELQSKKKDQDEHIANGRKIVELHDYPGSGANNRHTPRPPQFGRCFDC